MHSIYIVCQLRAAAVPLVMRMCSTQIGVAYVCHYPYPALHVSSTTHLFQKGIPIYWPCIRHSGSVSDNFQPTVLLLRNLQISQSSWLYGVFMEVISSGCQKISQNDISL